MPTKQQPASCHWCFTINNWTEAELKHLIDVASKECKYLVIGKEKGEQGTPHLQGYLHLNKKKRFAPVKKLLSPDRACHVERCKGSPADNITYCKKEGDFMEVGKVPVSQAGCRTDLESFKEAVQSGITDYAILIDSHSEVIAKYPGFCKRYITYKAPPMKVTPHPLRNWQAELYSDLLKKPTDRTVTFVVDYQGNSGKSWLARYYKSMFKSSTAIIRPAKKADMACSISEVIHQLRVIFIDCARASKEHMDHCYGFAEECKDGLVFSSKYESMALPLPRFPHVVFLMNHDPNMEKLSEDRFDIRILDEKDLLPGCETIPTLMKKAKEQPDPAHDQSVIDDFFEAEAEEEETNV